MSRNNLKQLVFLLLILGQNCFAQEVPGTRSLVHEVKKINILYPGFEQEKPMAEKMTWGYSLGTRFWYSWGTYYDGYGQSLNNQFEYFNLVPCGEVYGRWYYNIARRNRKHKKIANNSGSYFTAGAAIYFDGIDLIDEVYPDGDQIYVGVYAGWGWRRTFGRRIIFDLHLKVQPTMKDATDFEIVLLPGVHLGYLLFK